MSHVEVSAIQRQLARMAKSRAFAQAGRMFPLLEYLVAVELDIASERATQRGIAIEVFGRNEQFDPTTDAIVRVEVGRLRNKLREYYATDGVDDDVLVEVPRGRYRVRVHFRHSVTKLNGGDLAAQPIEYCTTRDGVRIAYTSLGEGYPLICLSHWLSHLEADTANPFVRHYWTELSRRFRLIRYDLRGAGLSQRDVPDLAFDDLVTDVETVLDALDIERCALLGPSGGGPVGAAYAARHPERVSHLMLLGSFIRGAKRDGNPANAEFANVLQAMIRYGWGQKGSRFRHFFVSMLVRPENAERYFAALSDFDLSEEVNGIRAPTVVFHGTEDTGVPFDEAEHAAACIPGARVVPLPTKNHVLMPDEPAWPMFLEEIERFVLRTDRSVPSSARAPRQVLDPTALERQPGRHDARRPPNIRAAAQTEIKRL